MKVVKKVVSLVLIAIVAVSALSISASAAGNITDKKYTFNFNLIGQANTGARAKKDSTSTYIKVNQIPNGGFQVYVDGSKNKENPVWTNRTINDAYVRRTGEFLIQQLVWENGERYARLGGFKLFASQSAKGVWSPDSVGSYSILNP